MTTLTAATPTMGGGLMFGPGQVARLAPLSQPGAPVGGLTGSDVVRVLRQRLILIITLFLIFTGLTAGFTLIMVLYYPRYYAAAMIQVKSAEPVNIMNPLEHKPSAQVDVQLLIQNQALIVKSQDVLRSVLDDPAIKATEWHRWALEDEADEDPVDLLNDIVSAVPRRDSNFVIVGATWEIPKEAALIANTVVRKYLDKVNELQRAGISQTRQQLEDALARAQRSSDSKRSELEQLRATAEVLGLPQGGGPSEHLLTLEALATELEVDMIGRRSQYELLNSTRPEDLPITAELQAILQADPVLFQLENAVRDAEQNLALAEARYGQRHPVVRNTRATAASADGRAAGERSAKLLRYQQEQIEQARQNYLEAQQQLMELQERLFTARAEQRDRDAKYARYLRLMEEQDLLRTQYEALFEQRNLVEMISRAQAFVQIDVPSLAAPPKRRSSPRWEIWMPAGMVLGLALSLGVALLLELADKSVRTPRDVPRVPVLGTIPTADDEEIQIPRVETACLDVPHSIIAEAFRNLRANLFFSAPAEQQGVILVTSPSGGNGKTTIATNLAISIALSGRRVLLIDANFRRPAIPRVFPGIRQEGLSNLLIGQGRLADLATTTSVPGCDVLGTGPTPPNPAEILGSSYLRDVIVDARAQYDQVVIDGPPVLLVSDAMVLAGAADGVLVVCQYRSTSRGAFQRMQTQLEAINARIFGAVLNKVETRAGGYFRKAYREFYQYHEPEEGAAVAELPAAGVGAGGVGVSPAAVATAKPPGELRQPDAGEGQHSTPTPPHSPPATAGPQSDSPLGAAGPQSSSNAAPPLTTSVQGPPATDIDEEIRNLDSGDILTIDDEFKIDDDFDLGEGLGEPRRD